LPEREGKALARSVWSGSISFGLVTIPVELYTATRKASPALRMLSEDGTPLARQYVCPEDGEVVSGDEIERGYEIEKGKFVLVTDEELEQLAPRRSRDISLDRFVDRHTIDPAFFVRSYFLVPSGERTKAYRLLAETMEATGRAAIASFVMRGHSHAVAIFADRGILRAQILRFGDELRSAEELDLPKAGKVDRARVAELVRSIESLAADSLDEAELVDDQAKRLVALAEQKREQGDDVVQAPEVVEPETEAEEEGETSGGQVLDLMALLKERLAERKPAHKRGKSKPDSAAGASRKQSRNERDRLEEASKQELYERARELDIPGRSKMSREELLDSVRRAG